METINIVNLLSSLRLKLTPNKETLENVLEDLTSFIERYYVKEGSFSNRVKHISQRLFMIESPLEAAKFNDDSEIKIQTDLDNLLNSMITEIQHIGLPADSNENEKQKTLSWTGDQYNISQAAAVGLYSQASNNSLNQNNFTLPHGTNYNQLEIEINKLKSVLIAKAFLPEHYSAISEIANVEIAIKNKEDNKIIKSLMSSGKWVLETAREIGVDVVSEIISKQIQG